MRAATVSFLATRPRTSLSVPFFLAPVAQTVTSGLQGQRLGLSTLKFPSHQLLRIDHLQTSVALPVCYCSTDLIISLNVIICLTVKRHQDKLSAKSEKSTRKTDVMEHIITGNNHIFYLPRFLIQF